MQYRGMTSRGQHGKAHETGDMHKISRFFPICKMRVLSTVKYGTVLRTVERTHKHHYQTILDKPFLFLPANLQVLNSYFLMTSYFQKSM